MLKNWKRELAVSCRWFLVWADPWLWEPIQLLEHDILVILTLAMCRHPVLVIGQNVIFFFTFQLHKKCFINSYFSGAQKSKTWTCRVVQRPWVSVSGQYNLGELLSGTWAFLWSWPWQRVVSCSVYFVYLF